MRPVKHGSVDQSVVVRIVDSVDGSVETGVVAATPGLDLWYRREGGLVVTITESDLPAVNSAHADGGIKHIANGLYRVDLPDAAFATGSTGVMIGGAATGMVVIPAYVPLVAYDPQLASLGLNNPSATDISTQVIASLPAGVPISDIGDELVNPSRPFGRAAKSMISGTASGSPTTTTMTASVSVVPTVPDQFKGRIIIFADNTTTAALRGQATNITASTAPGGGNATLTFTALTNAPVSGDTFVIT